MQEGGGGGIAAQGAEGREVVRPGAVPGAQHLLQEGEVAGGGTGEGGAVAAEVGHEEGAQAGALPRRLVEGVGEAAAVLDVVGRGGGGVEGEGEGAAEHAQLLHAERHAAAGSVGRGHAATIRANQTNSA